MDLKRIAATLGDHSLRFKMNIAHAYPEVVHPRFHCEIQLITYLLRQKITVYNNFVGVSKLMCVACEAYVNATNQESEGTERWKLTGSSKKAHYAWLIPPNALGQKAVRSIEEEFDRAVSNLFEKLMGPYPKIKSGGSDSSTGLRSDTGDDLDID